jgi:hypothetical protein
MTKMKNKHLLVWVLALYALSGSATAGPGCIIALTICNLIPEANALAVALAVCVFAYGGAKYAYSADDPGGRKQGKNIAINAMIGLIIVVIAKTIVTDIAGGAICGAC